MNPLQVAGLVVGYGLLALCLFIVVCAVVTSSIKSVITRYYTTKAAYIRTVMSMLSEGVSINDILQEALKKDS